MATFKLAGVGDFPFNRKKLLNTEGMLLEKVTGEKLAKILTDFNEGPGPLGLTAMLWLAMRRSGHHVKFEDLEYDFADLQYVTVDETDTAPTPEEGAAEPGPTKPVARKAAARSAPKKVGSPTK